MDVPPPDFSKPPPNKNVPTMYPTQHVIPPQPPVVYPGLYYPMPMYTVPLPPPVNVLPPTPINVPPPAMPPQCLPNVTKPPPGYPNFKPSDSSLDYRKGSSETSSRRHERSYSRERRERYGSHSRRSDSRNRERSSRRSPSRSEYSRSSRSKHERSRSRERYCRQSPRDDRYQSPSRRSPGDYRSRRSPSRRHSYYPRSSHVRSNSPRSSRYRERRRTRSRSRIRLHSTRERRERDKMTPSKKPMTDRELILHEFRQNYCSTSEELLEKLNKWAKEAENQGKEKETQWCRSSPAELFYNVNLNNVRTGTDKLIATCDLFKTSLIERGANARPAVDEVPPLPPQKPHTHSDKADCSDDSSESSDSDDGEHGASDRVIQELQRKQSHPRRLHPELWHNSPGEMNSGPLCRCSVRARKQGVRHGIYAGEPKFPKCDPRSNNIDTLFHYRITVSPPTNFLMKAPTIISHDEHEFLFSGFSLFSHYKLDQLPVCKVIRFNIEYTILYVEEPATPNFCVEELQLFEDFLFTEILELYDLDLGKGDDNHCSQFHVMPRFVRNLPENGQEVLSMCEVLRYLIRESKLLISPDTLEYVHSVDHYEWQRFVDKIKGTIVTKPGMKPCSLRVDQLDRSEPDDEPTKPVTENLFDPKNSNKSDSKKQTKSDSKYDEDNAPNDLESLSDVQEKHDSEKDSNVNKSSLEESSTNIVSSSVEDKSEREGVDRGKKEDKYRGKRREKKLYYPEIVHFGIRPPQLSYAGNPEYQKAWRFYVKLRHLVANMPKPSIKHKQRLQAKEAHLQEMRTHSKMKRDVTVAISSEGFYSTGLACDVIQHAMLIPVLVRHLRFHKSLDSLEKSIGYKFESRSLVQMAFTHPSYRENFGTNPDHARNSLTNCGIRQPEYGDRRIHYINTRKRGINTLIDIMSRFGCKNESESAISHNERLEFLGDAVVEFLSSIHLFRMFPGLAEGGLATFRAAIVQNQHLAQLAKKLSLEHYMLYAHGSDLCRELELRHAMANCFEALMGALFIDGGIEVADKVFSLALWGDDEELYQVWSKPRRHPLQEQEPLGDRKYIPHFKLLLNLNKFEESIGIRFRHIRLLARAFTDRSVGFTNLTLGSNQRLEFLGDTVLQLLVSDKLYRHFPDHHEGHLSLLRSSLVNNKTQARVCDDLAMSSYALYNHSKAEPSFKDKADLLEAFLGALYIDKNMEYCSAFCDAVLFPRLQEFIMNQDWNDPKSKLQQCCLTLRMVGGGVPDIPVYKVIECLGPTNTRVYTVAVYFRGKRLAAARGHSIQEAEMNAAKQALANSHDLFPQLDRQKRVIAKCVKGKKPSESKKGKEEKSASKSQCVVRSDYQVPKAYRLGRARDTSSDESSDDDNVEFDKKKTEDSDSGLNSDSDCLPSVSDCLPCVGATNTDPYSALASLGQEMEKVKRKMEDKSRDEDVMNKPGVNLLSSDDESEAGVNDQAIEKVRVYESGELTDD